MPTIACPKCQTKYKLPASSLGKPVKCQKCGATFRTQAPRQAPAQPAVDVASGTSRPQASAEELARLGIDGPLKRQADIFSAAPPPQRANPLGNFVLEDPGFADIDQARQEVYAEEGFDDGMGAILANPYAPSSKVGKGGKRRKGPEIDVSGYRVARVGMWIIFVSWSVMLGLLVLLYAFNWIGRLAPQMVVSVVDTIGAGLAGGIMLGLSGLMFFALFMVFVGQIICIFAPNRNEKIFAGLTVGSLVVAFLLPIVVVIVGAVTAGAGEVADAEEAAAAVVGILFLVTAFSTYVLILSNMFFFITYFKKIGQNIKSRAVVEASKTALFVWIGAIAVAIIAVVVMFVLTLMFNEDREFLQNAVNIVALVNAVLAFSVMGTLIAMVKATIDKTKPGTA